ncbi:hypothetical protein, variant [Aphanomyces invadans]|uniref:Major facilitator superfamily (MFS) profile domain-containing protein n=1 Tax=Aphanomyces invadans TaxID=157072 RepID=A0A024TMZ3_9STRA|nr:hypothetical protein, variant [Aphanomyces invadans]ETV95378.1 hypothetical protein, variant [Aphanomyces invadans]|eukprot:XP_008876079.1 hypothetical protein, variant [Aphanomyces invadans]
MMSLPRAPATTTAVAPPQLTTSSSQSMAEYYQQSAQNAPVDIASVDGEDDDDDSCHHRAATASMLLRLCVYGFFIELKPSEAYLNAFLTTEKGFSNQVTNDDIYPWFTYGQLVMLVVMPLFVERFQYRTVLLIESVGFLFTRVLLLWATSLFWMQAMQITYAIGTASKVVYLCMIYREVNQDEYHRATAVVWAASLGGQFAAGVLGQVLVSSHASLWLLNYISLANVCIAFVVAFNVPEHADQLLAHSTTSSAATAMFSTDVVTNLADDIQMRRQKRARNTVQARTWQWANFLAVTWVMFKCCESLASNYIQNRWTSFHDLNTMNGLVTALYTACGAIASWVLACCSRASSPQVSTPKLHGGPFHSNALQTQSVAPTLQSSYVSYVLYGCAYYAVMTTVSAELAKQCTTNEYAKHFAMVSLGAAVLETVVTFLLQDTSARTATWFDGITILHVALLGFYLFVFCRVRHDGSQVPPSTV